MQPKATEDMLNAMATVYPEGMASIVRFIAERPDALPAYHLRRAVNLYEVWRKRTGIDLSVQLGAGVTAPFPHWITMYSALRRWEDSFTPTMLASSPDVAVEFILQHLQQDDEKAVAVLSALQGLSTYNAALLDRMLNIPSMAALVPTVFAGCFDAFPPAALQRCLACPHIDQDVLLFRLSATNNPLHRAVHAELMQRALGQPINLHHFRYIASMLRGHSRHEAVRLLDAAPRSDENKWFWLAREIEAARGERLIDEAGHLRH